MNKYKGIEVRSEEVQEIMGQIPPWIFRNGITVIFLIVITLFIGSYFFKYPDVIVTEMTLSSTNPVAHIVARTSGRLSIVNIRDKEKVTRNNVLAIIENPAQMNHIEHLDWWLKSFGDLPDSILARIQNEDDFALGEIQQDYTAFIRAVNNYSNYKLLDYYTKKVESAKHQLERYQNYYTIQQNQHQIIKDQHTIAESQYTRDSLLFIKSIISPSEYELSHKDFLQSRSSLENSLASLENFQIQIAQINDDILDLGLQQIEQDAVIFQEYRTSLETLQNSINSWKLNYCLSTPIDGIVTFTKYWNVNQFVTAGETIFTIVPEVEDELIGIAMLPILKSGKAKVGQRVIIRLANYPDHEYGLVNGYVKSISLVPNDNYYRLEVELPNRLITNYGKELPVNQEMLTRAEIVTEELRLLERILQPIKNC
ncbi:MAG: HlyD family efflux transporter periplasmic adaptor subunit [Tannerellaceae bacterium]|nr:HlyD family efflux transporter periplasmic adaptor subunit [Tannerellaceae bacterium]